MELKEENFRKIADDLPFGLYIVEPDRTIVYWNKEAEQITGYKREEMVGKHCPQSGLFHMDEEGRSLCQFFRPLLATVESGEKSKARVTFLHKNGYRILIDTYFVPLKDENGETKHVAEIFEVVGPVEADSRLVENLHEIAFHDSLTELPNRLYMESILKVRFYEYHKLFRPFAVMFMDIDHFHDFNIKYGHVAGDMMLKSFADSIKENVRHEDVIGRWGGEEFVGVCPVPYEKDAVPIANRLRDVVNQAYIIKDGNKLSVTVSIGVTFVREEDTLKSIVDRADRLLFKAKQAGRDRIMIDADVPLVGKIERADIR